MAARVRATEPQSLEPLSAAQTPTHNTLCPGQTNFANHDRASQGVQAPGLFMKEDVMNRLEKVLYTAKVHTTGGRAGMSRSSDGRLEVRLSRPGGPARDLLADWPGLELKRVADFARSLGDGVQIGGGRRVGLTPPL